MATALLLQWRTHRSENIVELMVSARTPLPATARCSRCNYPLLATAFLMQIGVELGGELGAESFHLCDLLGARGA